MAATDTDRQTLENVKDEYKYGWSQPENYAFKSRKGLDHDIVEQISVMKGEPEWMRQLRHEALDIFLSKPIPTWGADLSAIDYQDIYYYIKPVESQSKSWDDVPADIKETFDKLGIPEAERKFLAGAGAQYESEAVYHSLKAGVGEARRHLRGQRHRFARAPGDLQGVLRHGRAVHRQRLRGAEHRVLVGRLVRLRAEGRASGHPAAGVLPHQRPEHGPVRAHADHRRRRRQHTLCRRAARRRATPRTRCTPA